MPVATAAQLLSSDNSGIRVVMQRIYISVLFIAFFFDENLKFTLQERVSQTLLGLEVDTRCVRGNWGWLYVGDVFCYFISVQADGNGEFIHDFT